MRLNLAECRTVIAIAGALEDGRLTPRAPVITARSVAAALGDSSRAAVLDVADLLTKLEVWPRMKGPNAYQRPMGDLVDAVAANLEEAAAAVEEARTNPVLQLRLGE